MKIDELHEFGNLEQMMAKGLKTLLLVAILAQAAGAATGDVTPARVRWQQDLKKAAAESKRTGKPMLIQVTAPWCGYCHKMFRETYQDPSIAKRVNECFVPVMLDADQNEQAVAILDITAFPSTIIISPTFDELGRMSGFLKPDQLNKKLDPFCKTEPTLKPATAEVQPAAAQLTAAAEPSMKPAFAGMCLVSMLQERDPIPGKPEFSEVYRGERLQFASGEHLAKFRADPQAYWPLFDGRCPVAEARREKDTLGNPETGGVFRNRLVFFMDVEHRKEFARSPRDYVGPAIGAAVQSAQQP